MEIKVFTFRLNKELERQGLLAGNTQHCGRLMRSGTPPGASSTSIMLVTQGPPTQAPSPREQSPLLASVSVNSGGGVHRLRREDGGGDEGLQSDSPGVRAQLYYSGAV